MLVGKAAFRQPRIDWKQPDGNLVKFSKGKCKAIHLGWHNSGTNCWEGGQQYPGFDQQECSQQVQRSDLPLYLVLVRPYWNSLSSLGFPNKRKILTYWNESHGERQDGWEGARRWRWSTQRGCRGWVFFSPEKDKRLPSVYKKTQPQDPGKTEAHSSQRCTAIG